MRVELAGRFAPGKRLEGLGGNEGLGLRRENRRHLVPRLDEQPRELGRLVGRDSACDAEENAGHAGILPARRWKRSPFLHWPTARADRKSTRLNSSHRCISYAVFCLN